MFNYKIDKLCFVFTVETFIAFLLMQIKHFSLSRKQEYVQPNFPGSNKY